MSRLNDYLPSREAELVTWSNNFSTRTNLTPLAYGLSVVQAAAFATVNTTWVEAYNTANSDLTNSRSATLAKNDAKRAMITAVRPLVKIVQAFPGLTDAQRADLGITVPAQRQPAPIPALSPFLKVKSSSNHVVTLELLDPTDNRRARPPKVALAYVFSWIGTTNPPTDITQWAFQGSVSKNPVRVAFSPDTPANAQVWFTAAYVNARQQPGQLSAPITTTIAGGVSAEQVIKLAA